MHVVESSVFKNKMIIYVWLHNMFYIWGFSFVFGNFNRLIFLISLTPINVTINILWASHTYARYSPVDGGENAQWHIVG